jgi:hypothetical protein
MSYITADIDVAKGSMLSRVARLSETRRKAFISGVVAVLKEHPLPSNIETVSLFNPITTLRRLLPQRKYDLLII